MFLLGNVAERFWRKVERGAPDECWPWRASMFPNGYGQFRCQAIDTALAHRASVILTRGPIPPGLVVDHVCRRRECVNPAHLHVVTTAENNARSEPFSTATRRAQAAARTAFACGHPTSPENTVRNGSGRACRMCNAERCRATYRRRREV